jgi:hypothetical protein
MPHSFLAFIDESGDDGFSNYREPGKNGGASNWLVLSACVFRKTNSLAAVAWRDDILRKIQRDKRHLHFVKLDHGQRIVAAQCLSEKPVRIVSVLASKKRIQSELYTKNQLYFYMTRYLIERISWLCRDMRPKAPEGNGQVAIMFSRRGGMSYEDFKSYLRLLKSESRLDVRIHWPVIDVDSVSAQDHSRVAGLQLVDIAASSFSAAVEHNRYGHCEDRYARMLKPIVYKHSGRSIGYGLKFIPRLEDCHLSAEQLRLIEAFE